MTKGFIKKQFKIQPTMAYLIKVFKDWVVTSEHLQALIYHYFQNTI